jgi:general secretion pathway protein A
VFTREAVMAIHQHSSGIPRVISVISDNALLAGFAAGIRPVTSGLVEEVCREFDIHRSQFGDETFDGLTAQQPAAAQSAPVTRPYAQGPAAATSQHSAARHATGDPTAVKESLFQHYVAAGKRRFSFF